MLGNILRRRALLLTQSVYRAIARTHCLKSPPIPSPTEAEYTPTHTGCYVEATQPNLNSHPEREEVTEDGTVLG